MNMQKVKIWWTTQTSWHIQDAMDGTDTCHDKELEITAMIRNEFPAVKARLDTNYDSCSTSFYEPCASWEIEIDSDDSAQVDQLTKLVLNVRKTLGKDDSISVSDTAGKVFAKIKGEMAKAGWAEHTIIAEPVD